jgi:hypothetical protein
VVALAELLLLRAGELEAELVGDLARHLLLQLHEVGELAVVGLAPQLRAVERVDQLDVDLQPSPSCLTTPVSTARTRSSRPTLCASTSRFL